LSTSLSRRPAGAVPLAVLGRLTERDRQLCRLLWEHRVLTTAQIAEVAFDSLVAAQHRLVVLYRLGVLERFRSLRSVGSESWRYSLGPTGAALVAIERGVEPPRASVTRAKVAKLAASPRTAHALGVNGLFTALAAHARRHQACALEEWWSERRAGAEWGDLVRPDAYGQWREDARSVGFFVEHDTGSETLARVTAKLSGYADVSTAEGLSRPVLFWLARGGREPELHRVMARRPVPMATAVARPGADPAGPVWRPVGTTSRCRLIDLAETAPQSWR
jgi:hypothetical protein